MTPNNIVDHLRRVPFRPLRFYISDGSSYEVHHPEMAIVTLMEVAIAIASSKGELPERMVYCDPRHITRIEPINGKRKPPGKSKKGRKGS
jgi:hypothetical protein